MPRISYEDPAITALKAQVRVNDQKADENHDQNRADIDYALALLGADEEESNE